MGRAINKAVTIAEILKRKMPLHQVTYLTSSEIIDVSRNTKKRSAIKFVI
jgi:DNA-binding protein